MNYETFKRIMDIFLAVSLGIIFLPISLIVAVAIKLESPDGPIFADTPPRVGKNGKLFVTYKFRSMIPNAVNYLKEHPELFEKYKKNSFKLVDDPRVTNVGRFIRKYSLDEVPQFINVLLGDMSLIGPRPYYKDELEEQQSKYPF
ncbi:MAG: sugar transferase, partial [Patescibacteria group bacterium]